MNQPRNQQAQRADPGQINPPPDQPHTQHVANSIQQRIRPRQQPA